MGPPIKSPKVPASSTSPTKTPSAIPPKPAPPAYSKTFPFLLRANSCTSLLIGAILNLVALGTPLKISTSSKPFPVKLK